MDTLNRYFIDQLWFFRATWPPLALSVLVSAIAWFSPLLWLDILSLLGIGLLTLDTFARQKQFSDLRLELCRAGGLTGHALARFRKARTAWCSRRAAIAASFAEGFGEESRLLVHEWGYKPWHIFPDGAFTKRSPFLRMGFWKSVLGFSRG